MSLSYEKLEAVVRMDLLEPPDPMRKLPPRLSVGGGEYAMMRLTCDAWLVGGDRLGAGEAWLGCDPDPPDRFNSVALRLNTARRGGRGGGTKVSVRRHAWPTLSSAPRDPCAGEHSPAHPMLPRQPVPFRQHHEHLALQQLSPRPCQPRPRDVRHPFACR